MDECLHNQYDAMARQNCRRGSDISSEAGKRLRAVTIV